MNGRGGEPVPVGKVVHDLVAELFPEGFMPEGFLPLEPEGPLDPE